MKLAFSTNAFTKTPLLDVFEIIRKIGYQGVEIMADRPHLWPQDVDESSISDILKALKETNLEVANINGFMMKVVGDIHHPSWIEKDEALRKQRLDHTRACLNLAKRLGAPSVSTEPGGPLESDKKRAFDWFRIGILQAAKAAEALEVRLLIEPEPHLLLEGMDETVRFMEEIGNPKGLGINFDIGHFFCIGLDPMELILKHGQALEHVHIEDIGEDKKHLHLIPGRGAIDFDGVFGALKDTGYSGFVTVELYPYEETPVEAAQQAFDFLAPYFESL